MVISTRVGLVLRAKTVDAIEIVRGLRGVRVSKVICVPVQGPEDSHIVEALRTAMAGVSAKRARVGVTIAAPEILLRAFTMPLLPQGEREAGVGFEARRHIPFKTEELAWNYHVTERRAAKQMHAVFVGIRTQTLTRIQGLLAQAGVTPAFIEAQSVSLSRLVASLRGSTGGCVGLIEVDLASQAAHLVVVNDRIPSFSRDVRLQDGVELVPTDSQGPDPRAKLLLSELRLSLDFFARENPAVAVERLVLFGDPAVVGGWTGWLAEQLNRPVVMGTLPIADRSGGDLPPQHACALGLMLKGLQFPRLALEFTQHHLVMSSAEIRARASLQRQGLEIVNKLTAKARKIVTPPFIKTVAVQVSAAACLLAVLMSLGTYRVRQARAEFLRVTRSLSQSSLSDQVSAPLIVGLEQRSSEELQGLSDAIHRRLSILQQAIQGRLMVTEKLSLLADLLPEGIWLDGLTFAAANPEVIGASRQTSLTLMGSCFLPESRNELDVISTLSSQLKRHPVFFHGFQTSQLGEITIRDAGPDTSYRTFTLTLQGEGAG